MSEQAIKIGTESKCSDCGKPVVYTGKYWEHIGVSYRHSANPSVEDLRLIKTEDEEENATIYVHLQ